MEARLKVIAGPFTGHVIPLSKGRFLIGREPDCQCLLDTPSVSRHHCILLLDDWTLRVRDLKSKNGTFVNRSRIAPGDMTLADGDVIAVGEWVARVELTVLGASTRKEGEDESLATKHFESDTTQVDSAAPRPAELGDQR
ncbi:MAG: FHA domain-containing protein [Planctomycetaceae bacterium]